MARKGIKITVKIKRNALKRLLGIEQELLIEFAEKATEIAKREAPKVSGNLARNIFWEALPGGGVIIFTSTGYGGWVEIGTSFFEGRRFIAKGVAMGAREVLGD